MQIARQLRSDKSDRHLLASIDIACSAYDLQCLACTCIYLANVQFISVRMLLFRDDITDDNT
ncbi:hypothetical protein D3C84_1182280 [compost metagenome]